MSRAKIIMTGESSLSTGHKMPLATDQADGEIVHLVDHLSVDLQVPVRDEHSRSIIARFDLGLNPHALVRRNDLAAISPAMDSIPSTGDSNTVDGSAPQRFAAATFNSCSRDSNPSEPGQTGSRENAPEKTRPSDQLASSLR